MPLHFQANIKKLPKVTQASKGGQRLYRENAAVMELREVVRSAAQVCVPVAKGRCSG